MSKCFGSTRSRAGLSNTVAGMNVTLIGGWSGARLKRSAPDADTANTLPRGRTTSVQFACPNSDGPAEGWVNRCPTRITMVRSVARRRSIPDAAWPCLAVRSLKPPSAAALAFRDSDLDGSESSSTSVAERSPSLSSLDDRVHRVKRSGAFFF
jgi:hypothetical protein